MKNILVISASIFGQQGQSSQLVEKTVANLLAQHPEATITRRDLATDPVPHLTGERFAALLSVESDRTEDQQNVLAYSDALISEIRDADAVVLGVPMYNFGIPSALKAYFDHIARAGVTFRYTENGPVGLLEDRPVYVLAARGGIYEGTANDSQTPYIRSFLGFLGLNGVQIVYAEGLNMGNSQKHDALTKAESRIDALTA
ncbi:FMN-dependent NADH-azoreductase [Marinobacter salicampi]|uniref:FMN-dependent NADH-azoreductase n=1 Tax=Marinobacter salicampi TaxID=435907 RepID=UPI00140C2D1D|nr:FMN-dependent NADH-azoreductase [Marinobacter salicampi]